MGGDHRGGRLRRPEHDPQADPEAADVPFAIVTLGIAWFFVSLFMLWLTVVIVANFTIDGFWNYVWATVIIWVLNMIVDRVLSPARDDRSALA